jgi:hypothetical protein
MNNENNMDFSLTQNPDTESATNDLPPFHTAAAKAKDDVMSDKPKLAASAITDNGNDNKDTSNVAGKQVTAHPNGTEVSTIVTDTIAKTV